MKKIIEEEAIFCDRCEGRADFPSTCRHCGSQHCYSCREKHGVEYNHAVHFSGSDDGYYCNECDAELQASKSDALHCAYLAIMALRQESKAFSEDTYQKV